MAFTHPPPQDRLKAAIGAVALQALMAWAFLVGLATQVPAVVREHLTLISILTPPPPPPEQPPPHPVESSRPEGRASPPNIRSRATEIAAPQPVIQLPVPTPVIAAPKPFTQADPSSGSADIAGPGTGAGGQGDGFGSGGDGDGDGAGGGGSPPRWLRGRLRNSDYPRGLGEEGIEGTVSVRYAVEIDGSVTHCVITHSSGSRELDYTTCRLIEQRFRFAPSRDRSGRPQRSWIVENHSWIIHDEPPEEYRRY
ncbi:MAG TPA: TonB family protein [Allosphingosinicella sp.]|jgi:protein TonB